jgi:hypothetical protein
LQDTYGPDLDWLLLSRETPDLKRRWNELVDYGASRWRRYYELQQKANRSASETTELQKLTLLVESNLKYLEALTPESKKQADEQAAQRHVRRLAAAEIEKNARAYETLANSSSELRKFLGEMSQRYQLNAPANAPVKAQNGTAQGSQNSADLAKTSLEDLVKLALLHAAQNQRIIEQNQQIISNTSSLSFQLERLIAK